VRVFLFLLCLFINFCVLSRQDAFFFSGLFWIVGREGHVLVGKLHAIDSSIKHKTETKTTEKKKENCKV
jgi:hypothetical protein